MIMHAGPVGQLVMLLLLFFSIMGGISLFGLLGIIVGPMVAAVFVTLLRIFETRLHSEEITAADT